MLKDIKEVMQSALVFNEYLIDEFQAQFDGKVLEVAGEINTIFQQVYDKISPLRIQLGYLHSDLQQGVAKFFNSNFKEGQEILSQKHYH